MTATDLDDPTPDVSAHLAAGPPLVGDVSTLPSHGELSRTLLEPGAMAALATITSSGHPYTSLVPTSTRPGSEPIICISALAEHTQNLRRDRRASLLVAQDVPDGADPLAYARVTLVGTFEPYAPSDADLEHHLAVHEHADDYIGFEDFSWWRFATLSVRYVGGFGFMGWASGDDLHRATADPVIPHATPMIEHLNDDHADACVEIVRHLGGVPDAVAAVVTGVDRYGLTFDAHATPGVVVAISRVGFAEPVTSPADVRAASVELVRRARELATG
jgi:heme iron utilization protein